MGEAFNIIRQINELTLKIEFKYPELYRNLEEVPLKFQKNGGELDNKALYDYLQSLKEIVSRYEQSHLKSA